jgi:hypothetical protein
MDSDTITYLAVLTGLGLVIAVLLERVSPRRPRNGRTPQHRPRDDGPGDLI